MGGGGGSSESRGRNCCCSIGRTNVCARIFFSSMDLERERERERERTFRLESVRRSLYV